MSKNVALFLSELVVAIVFATVVPDWECKSGSFIFNTQATVENNLQLFFDTSANTSVSDSNSQKLFKVIFKETS